MAFSTTGLTSVAASKRGNAPSIYAYKTADAMADVNTAGYFNYLSDTLEVGDLIYCVTSTGTTAVATLAYVLSNAAGVVDVSDGTVLANTDTD
jgi:glyceraldehyde-3-phosphate dehydrogenase/erythrose-4-phosphate dehydrogenase|tara:strand:- start:57 stop:335 length:279 start_codon:yes stop_codon:yes gene_type:complete